MTMYNPSVAQAVDDFIKDHPSFFKRNKKSRRKVFVIGLDGASFSLLGSFIEKGLMPHLKNLIDEGAWGTLTSTVAPITSLAWPAALTGKGPGKLGTFTFRTREKNSYRLRPISTVDIRSPFVWDILSQARRSCCVLNVPLTYPPRIINGVMVNSWDAPSKTKAVFTYPAFLSHYLRKAHFSLAGRWGDLDYVRYNLGQLFTLAHKLRVVEWDFFMVVLHQIDTLSHFFYNDSGAWEDILPLLDKGIAQLLDSIDEETTVLIFSDHGIRYYPKIFSLNHWLIEQGYLSLKPFFLSPGLFNLFKKIKNKCRRTNTSTNLSDYIDWRKTAAYAYEYTAAHFGAVRFNYKGREPLGLVSHADYERLLCEISQKLLSLTNRGEKIIKRVYRRDELYHGERIADLPDIIFEAKKEYSVDVSISPYLEELFYPNKKYFHADHDLEGMVLLYGNHIIKGKKLCAEIVDIAPTILYLMGVPASSDMDGNIIEEAIKEGYKLTHPNKQKDYHHTFLTQKRSYSPYEQEQMEEKLRSLGYI